MCTLKKCVITCVEPACWKIVCYLTGLLLYCCHSNAFAETNVDRKIRCVRHTNLTLPPSKFVFNGNWPLFRVNKEFIDGQMTFRMIHLSLFKVLDWSTFGEPHFIFCLVMTNVNSYNYTPDSNVCYLNFMVNCAKGRRHRV